MVVELDTFTLEGRPIRYVRQSVARLQRAGYSAELRSLDEIAPAEMREIEHVMEVVIVAAIEGLRARGVEEMSLNFAALTKYLRNPQGLEEHLLGWIAGRLDRHLQIESLYRANAKFLPRWDPRYLIYERRLDFPQAVIAAMWIEEQLPRPELPHWHTHPGQRTIKLVNR